MKFDEFDIILDTWTKSQVDSIPSCRYVKTQACLSDIEFLTIFESKQDKKYILKQKQIKKKVKRNKSKNKKKASSSIIKKGEKSLETPKRIDMIDLIPMTITTPENDDCDSVSCPSSYDSSSSDSGSSSSDCEDNSSLPKAALSLERPGIRLNLDMVAPPSKDEISSLPKTKIFKCHNSHCGFSTSSSVNIGLHSCVRPR